MTAKNRIWLLMGKKLSGSSTVEEDKELDELFKTSPDAWYAYEVMSATEIKDEIPEDFINQISALLHQENHHVNNQLSIIPSHKAKRKAIKFRLAVTCLLLTVTGMFVWWKYPLKWKITSPEVDMTEVMAQNGTNTEVTLPDGSNIKLNSGSKITYPKNFTSSNSREVTLSGEAYFKVVHNKKHPFVIHTASIDIIDLGTVFNVKAYPGDHTIETSLIEGSIEVVLRNHPSSGRILLKPNEKLIFYDHKAPDEKKSDKKTTSRFEIHGITPTGKKDEFVETAWINNKLIFQDEKFEDLAYRMERRYNISIDIKDEKLKNLRLTGVFKNESIIEATKELQMFTPFKYSFKEDKLIIIPVD